MKTQSQAALQFSGYPLTSADNNQLNKQNVNFFVVAAYEKRVSKKHEQQPDLVNNPENWDTGWFNNYE